jgi:hypothetical protein
MLLSVLLVNDTNTNPTGADNKPLLAFASHRPEGEPNTQLDITQKAHSPHP